MRYVKFLVVIGLIFVFSGCGEPEYSAYRDPFGMTTREDIRAGRDVRMTELQTGAAVQVAEYDYKARSDVAYYQSSAIKTQARQETYRSLAWAGISPILVLMIVAGLILTVALLQFGKVAATQAQSHKMFPNFDDWRK